MQNNLIIGDRVKVISVPPIGGIQSYHIGDIAIIESLTDTQEMEIYPYVVPELPVKVRVITPNDPIKCRFLTWNYNLDNLEKII